MRNYNCDHCGKKFDIESEGNLLFPNYTTVCQGEAFIYCSNSCKHNGMKNVITSKEVDFHINSHLNSNMKSYVSFLTSF